MWIYEKDVCNFEYDSCFSLNKRIEMFTSRDAKYLVLEDLLEEGVLTLEDCVHTFLQLSSAEDRNRFIIEFDCVSSPESLTKESPWYVVYGKVNIHKVSVRRQEFVEFLKEVVVYEEKDT